MARAQRRLTVLERKRLALMELGKWLKGYWLPYMLNRLRKRFVALAPSTKAERDMVVKGVVSEWAGVRRFGPEPIIGTHKGGRYQLVGPSIRGFLGLLKISIEQIGSSLVPGFRTSHPISHVGKFAWRRRDGTRHTGLPWAGKFLMAVEKGKPFLWTVKPRRDNRRGVLGPEPGVFAKSMVKRAKQYAMMATAVRELQPEYVAGVQREAQRLARRYGV